MAVRRRDYRRVVVQRRIRRIVVVILMILAFCSGFLGHTLVSAHAKEQAQPQLNRYYTSIQLQHGDSLWSIAGRYMEGSGYTQKEYMRELVRMNGLMTDQIHSGEYLTVMYMAE